MDGGAEQEAAAVGSSRTEPSSLRWSRERETGQDRTSVGTAEAASCTESEGEVRSPGARGQKGGGEDEPLENQLPETAARVFSPHREEEKRPFLDSRVRQDYNQRGFQDDWLEESPPRRCGRGCSSREALKVGVSLATSALIFPFLVWGGFVFLPFDAPLMDGAPLRLIYTLRCSVFAVAPIVLGWLVLGISRLRSGAFRPLFDEQVKGEELHDVTTHRRFVSDSVSLFLIYFVQLVVMAMYLSQENLKLVPLLIVVFALGRLVYWVAAAFGSTIRGFGFGLSFLPSLVMMVANIYFIFTVEAAGSIFSLTPPTEEELTPPAGKQRFWG